MAPRSKRGPYLVVKRVNPLKAHPQPRAPLTPEQQPPHGARAIQLTKGWVAWVDAADYEALSKWSWSVSGGPSTPAGDPRYAIRGTGGRHESAKTIWMHREIMRDSLPAKGARVDHREHRNHVRIVDNRRCNLRPATDAENARNSRKIKRGASIYKGVTQTGRKGQFWQARIRVDGRCKELGCYHTPERAALAYDEAAMRHFGEFAWLNFPREMQA